MNSAKALIDLQTTDEKLAVRRAAHEKLVAQLETQGGLDKLREECEKARTRVLETQVDQRRLESEAATQRERLAALEERLYGGAITNVRELTAVELEHSAARRALAQVEEALGPGQMGVADVQTRHEELTRQLAEREAAWTAIEAKLKAARNRLGKEIEECDREREEGAKAVPPADLSVYESLLVRKAGVAVVRVSRGVCQGCRVRLPLREIARLRTADGLVWCSSCGRILLAE